MKLEMNKGGLNKRPTTPRPEPPMPQSLGGGYILSKKYELPMSKYSMGYTHEEIESIRKQLKIEKKAFYDALGANTGSIVDGHCLTYKCDIERALHILQKPGGKYHMWD